MIPKNRIPIGNRDGFILTIEAWPDESDMKKHFVKECGWTEKQFGKIKDYDWFGVTVSAWKGSKCLGKDHLGGCAAKDATAYLRTNISGYLRQMIEEAIREAKNA